MAQYNAPTIPGYELIRELGAGGMATVYLAIQRSLERKVAIKIMRRGVGGDEQEKAEKRFLVEGRTMAKLPHRNIVAVYDIVKQDEYSYIAMEYLDGGTLSDKMKAGLSLAEAISVVAQIAGALQFAHDHGVVHRDLKPANIMFRDDHTPVLTDFGIAKQQDASATRLTQTGMLVGTPTYMSPEQINALEVDGRSDLYSLGVLFFEMLTGRPPFRGDTPIAVLMSHLTTPPPPLPEPFREFQSVLDKTLAKSRDDRFASMKEFTRALKAAVTHNQLLWQKLQADPNQSSSEQLRALGFSISTQEGSGADLHGPRTPPVTAGVNVSGELASRAAGLLSNAAPTTVAAKPKRNPVDEMAEAMASSGVQTAPTTISKRDALATSPTRATPQTPPVNPSAESTVKSRAWLLPAALAAMVLIGLASWLMLKPKSLDSATQKIVDSALLQYDDAFSRGALIEPAEQSAMDRMMSLREVAPDYEPVKERIAKLTSAIEDQAKQLAASGEFDGANLTVRKLQEFDPKYPGLDALLDDILAKQRMALNQKEVDRLLRDAQSALNTGRVLGVDGAYALAQKARALIPNYPASDRLYAQIVERALQPAQLALTSRDWPAAEQALVQIKTDLASEKAYQLLAQQVQAGKAQAQQDAALATLWTRFDAQMAASQLLEPSDKNAYLSLEEARRLVGGDNAEVKAKQAQLLGRLIDTAESKQKAGQASDAIALATIALKLDPSSIDATRVRSDAEGQLSARDRDIAQGLSRAREALAAQRFLTPANDNVKLHLDAVLRIDANNNDAKGMLKDLPKQVVSAIENALKANQLTVAESVLQSAQAGLPNERQWAELSRQLAARQQQLAANQKREQALAQIAKAIATRPLIAAEFTQSAKTVQNLLALNPKDVDASTFRQRMIEVLVEEARAAQNANDLDRVQKLFDSVRIALGGSSAITSVASALAAAKPRIATLEADRLAATGGVLIIDAAPWATVESVLDANRQAMALPAQRETPMRLTLPAGVYTISLRHPNAKNAVTQTARVSAKTETLANKAMAVGSREEYLQRAKL